MTDFIGNELHIGDDVVYLHHSKTSSSLIRGSIIRITNKMVCIGNTSKDGSKFISLSALRLQQQPDEPLTLAELKQMDGKTVWCKSLRNGGGEWAILHIVEMSKSWFISLAGAEQGFGTKIIMVRHGLFTTVNRNRRTDRWKS